MNNYPFNAASLRITKARAAAALGTAVAGITLILLLLFLAAGLFLLFFHRHQGLILIGIGVGLLVFYIWDTRDLGQLQPATIGSTKQLDQLLPADLLSRYRAGMTAAEFWQLLANTRDGRFIDLRFGLDFNAVAAALGSWQVGHDQYWDAVTALGQELNVKHVSVGLAICTLFRLNQQLDTVLTKAKLTQADLGEGALWIDRLDYHITRRRPLYGGIARDWANGYTPLLDRFGTNLSQQVEFAPGFGLDERTTQLQDLVTGLQSGTGSVILVGEPGIGKTALLIGLADQLLAGEHGPLAHHQIVSLSASLILSSVEGPGDLERIVLQLFDEALRAGNIVLALDEAQLFFGQGTGAVNLSQVLLPILQARSIRLVLAVTPGDWQKLRATNSAMASLITPLVLSEPGEADTVQLEADHALTWEQGRVITTYRALTEAYRLSGRYLEEEAYPGRAIKLLEAAFNHPDGQYITDRSVQQAVESQFGVKVQQATAAESDALLHLEDRIHQRMINQARAVSVVAAALRRARAGVASPKRPLGSFLFLGPTGVGKTELARSLAATYFNAENNIIRLDMSEYQQTADVDRILESAAQNPSGLLAQVRQSPFSVVLFDEIEKAHPNVLNLFLQLLDEGKLTDTEGHPASFKDAIIIATSNAGADVIRQQIDAGQKLEDFEQPFINDLIDAGVFRPELLNRFDEIVLFRPLTEAELGQVVKLMMAEVNKTLANQKITVELTDDAAAVLVSTGYDPRLGARPMRREVQRRVEDAVAGMILRGEAQPGDHITLDAAHLATTGSDRAGDGAADGDAAGEEASGPEPSQ
jgi:ATP-dependent Clp protease ATP-binding subunit ClpC